MLFKDKSIYNYYLMKLYIDNREPKKIINLITNLCEDKSIVEVK